MGVGTSVIVELFPGEIVLLLFLLNWRFICFVMVVHNAFLPAAVVILALLYTITGTQWRIAFTYCVTACSAAGVVGASKVRMLRLKKGTLVEHSKLRKETNTLQNK